MKLLQICLSIVFKWAEDNGYLKSAILAADKTIIKSFEWLSEQDLFKERYIQTEFYNIHLLRRSIGIFYFNKVNDHYFVEHSLQKYSRNQIEYNLTVWEEIGILANIGLTEIKHYQYHYDAEDPSLALKYAESAKTIADALISLVDTNPPSSYPMYDDHLIDIEPALRFLYLTGHKEECTKWLKRIIIGIYDAKVLKGFFPLFQKDYENLIDYYLGLKEQNEKSSMLLTLLADWTAILNSNELYQNIRSIVHLFEGKLNLQIWFPKTETENLYLSNLYSRQSGKVKHSINLYDSIKEYSDEIVQEFELFHQKKTSRQ